MTRITVLLVEDDDMLRDVTSILLEDLGWTVDTAATAEAGLEAFDPTTHEVVVTDLAMPGRGGMDLIATLHRRYPQLPVIVVSAFGDRRRIDAALEQGATTYLQKPLRAGELAEAIEQVSRRPALNAPEA